MLCLVRNFSKEDTPRHDYSYSVVNAKSQDHPVKGFLVARFYWIE